MSILHRIFWLSPALMMTLQYVTYFGVVDNIMFLHSTAGKSNINRMYAQSDSPGGSTCSIQLGQSLIPTIALFVSDILH